MARPPNFARIRDQLMTCQDGIEAHCLIAGLMRVASDHAATVRDILAAYVKEGPLGHVREYTTARLADLATPGDATLADLFNGGVSDPHTAYWSVQGLIRTSGAASYPRLFALALDTSNRLEVRANAIREMGLHSGQHFIVGLRRDTGHWKEEQLPMAGLRKWAEEGFPLGPGFAEPGRHPSLDNPRSPLEAAAGRLDEKLAKSRAQRQDLVNPSNWLRPATETDLAVIGAKWNLPSAYLDFLERFSPLEVNLTTRRFYQGLNFYGASELIDRQSGYAWGGEPEETFPEWPAHYVVVAEHGQGDWDFRKEAPSFLAFLEKLAR